MGFLPVVTTRIIAWLSSWNNNGVNGYAADRSDVVVKEFVANLCTVADVFVIGVAEIERRKYEWSEKILNLIKFRIKVVKTIKKFIFFVDGNKKNVILSKFFWEFKALNSFKSTMTLFLLFKEKSYIKNFRACFI